MCILCTDLFGSSIRFILSVFPSYVSYEFGYRTTFGTNVATRFDFLCGINVPLNRVLFRKYSNFCRFLIIYRGYFSFLYSVLVLGTRRSVITTRYVFFLFFFCGWVSLSTSRCGGLFFCGPTGCIVLWGAGGEDPTSLAESQGTSTMPPWLTLYPGTYALLTLLPVARRGHHASVMQDSRTNSVVRTRGPSAAISRPANYSSKALL